MPRALPEPHLCYAEKWAPSLPLRGSSLVECRKCVWGNSLAVQWWGLRTSTAWGTGSIPGWGTKNPQATRRSQKEKKKVCVCVCVCVWDKVGGRAERKLSITQDLVLGWGTQMSSSSSPSCFCHVFHPLLASSQLSLGMLHLGGSAVQCNGFHNFLIFSRGSLWKRQLNTAPAIGLMFVSPQIHALKPSCPMRWH